MVSPHSAWPPDRITRFPYYRNGWKMGLVGNLEKQLFSCGEHGVNLVDRICV